MNETTCAVCRRTFRYTEVKGRPKPEICGQVPCRARHEWTDADWKGKARMARARQQADIPLHDIDREALRRTPTTGTPVLGGTALDYDEQGKQESAPAPDGTGPGLDTTRIGGHADV